MTLHTTTGPIQLAVSEIGSRTGQVLGCSAWRVIDQAEADAFGAATHDEQWIHTDPQRAAHGPFGRTIAHGYLTLSLGPTLAPQIMAVEGITMGVNYGCEKVRFPSPVPVGAKLRLGAALDAVDDIAGGAQVTMTFTYEVEDAPKPSCVAVVVFRYYE